MTSLLEKAFDVASKLPTLEQNILARTLLDEIELSKLSRKFPAPRLKPWTPVGGGAVRECDLA